MIILEKRLAEIIIGQCKREHPFEACGILAGSSGRGEKVYEMTNAERSAETFLMDPKEQFKVMKDMRALNLEMVGIYHSHVASEAYPSSHDVKMAFYPEASYVIVSLKSMDNPVMRSFKIVGRKITEEELKIV